ncbi:MAG TPA: NAD(P)-dependent oxidoreductase [Streptosporangiaceae bacterium]|nr:NAD(P)-dependent oxidoreductase [Streptosporangiaceae bacterium]
MTAETVGFVGLGNMGTPMTGRLAAAGYQVRGYDADPRVRERSTSITVVDTVLDAAAGAGVLVLMLPDSAAVESVLIGDGLLDRLAPGTILVDMGSSEPARTRELSAAAAERGVPMVDAPVSGGVRGAREGTLTIMVGGAPEHAAALRPMFETLGRKVMHVGPAGAGHALKALNNLLSATHLLVSSEAILAGQEFGLDPKVMLEVINGSSGRSGSTENKWPNYILERKFGAGFPVRLMLKDMRIAVELARQTGRPSRLGEAAVALWAEAADRLPADADHTEIVRWLEGR